MTAQAQTSVGHNANKLHVEERMAEVMLKTDGLTAMTPEQLREHLLAQKFNIEDIHDYAASAFKKAVGTLRANGEVATIEQTKTGTAKVALAELRAMVHKTLDELGMQLTEARQFVDERFDATETSIDLTLMVVSGVGRTVVEARDRIADLRQKVLAVTIAPLRSLDKESQH